MPASRNIQTFVLMLSLPRSFLSWCLQRKYVWIQQICLTHYTSSTIFACI